MASICFFRQVFIIASELKLFSVFTYQITVTVGEVCPNWSDTDHVYIYMYGEQGQTGRRLLKHSLTNTAKIKQNQVFIALAEIFDCLLN